jgi:hypothetical protein
VASLSRVDPPAGGHHARQAHIALAHQPVGIGTDDGRAG